MDVRDIQLTRRRVLQLGALTASLPALSSVLAACGGGGEGSGAVKFSGWTPVRSALDRQESA